MKKKRIKRNFYRKPKYYHTALRFMVEIYRAKKKNVEIINIIKTQNKYVINAYYTINVSKKKDWQSLRKVPITINMPILSKDRNDLKISMHQKMWLYRQKIRDDLMPFYLSLRKDKKPDRGTHP